MGRNKEIKELSVGLVGAGGTLFLELPAGLG